MEVALQDVLHGNVLPGLVVEMGSKQAQEQLLAQPSLHTGLSQA